VPTPFDDDVVEVDDDTDELTEKAAGVKSNGNVLGDIGGSELSELELDLDDDEEDLEDLDERVEADDDE